MKSAITAVCIAILSLIVGFGVILNWDVPLTHKQKIEAQLTRYKEAQEVCGVDNVEEITEYVNARTEDTGNYTCEFFAEAAESPEVKKREVEELVKDGDLYNRYVEEYVEDGGVLNFYDWKERNIK